MIKTPEVELVKNPILWREIMHLKLTDFHARLPSG